MEEAVSFKNKVGESLVGFLHKPPKPSKHGVVLAHCFTCSKSIRVLRKTCDKLAAAGFLILRFDFSGNGDSGGKFEESTYSKQITDLECAVNFMVSQGTDCLGLLGLSMGATVSILYSSIDDRISSVCVLGAPADTRELQKVFSKEELEAIKKKGEKEVKLFGRKLLVTKAFLADTEKHDVAKAVKMLRKPLCVIHGSADTIIAVENAKKLFAMAKEPKELHLIKGADHLFTADADLQEVDEIVLKWFKERC